MTSTNRSQDHYAVLKIAPEFPTEQIAALRRSYSRELHPDKFQHLPSDERDALVSRLKAINEACDILGDAQRRAKYDRERMLNALHAEREARHNRESSDSNDRSAGATTDGSRDQQSRSKPDAANAAPVSSSKSTSTASGTDDRKPRPFNTQEREARYNRQLVIGVALAYITITIVVFLAGHSDNLSYPPDHHVGAGEWIFFLALVMLLVAPVMTIPATILVVYPVCLIIRSLTPVEDS